MITFERQGSGTKYTALAMHKDEATRRQHEEMGSTGAGAPPSTSS